MRSVLTTLLALTLLSTGVAGAQRDDRWELGALPDDTLFEYPTTHHYEWLRWRVCSRGTSEQFSDCLVKVHLLERAWDAFIEEAFKTPLGVTRAEFAETLDRLYDETERMDSLFPLGRLVR